MALLDRGLEQLDDGQAPPEVLSALFSDRSGSELAQSFSEIAGELAAAAEAAGIDGFVGGGALVVDPTGSSEMTIADRRDGAATTRVVQLTGVPAVDDVIGAVLQFSGDFAPLEALLTYTITECTLELGVGGPPKCWQVPGAAQVEGTEVEVFPTSVCEAEYEPRHANITRILGELVAPGGVPGSVEGVYAVYQLPSDLAREPYWPEGDYAVVFSVRTVEETQGTRVRIADGGIVRIDFGCGRVPPEELAVPDAINLLARTVEPTSGVGPGLSVQEAVASRLAGPLLVHGYVVIAGGETRLCQTLDQSQPPSCGDPSLVLEGFEPDSGTLAEGADVAWTSEDVQILGERVGERLIVQDNSLAK